MTTIAIVTPGAMGASVGAAARQSGNTVYWASASRSAATRARADRAELLERDSHAELATCDVVLSVCPPHLAEEVGIEFASLGFKGIYVEGNAISPARTRRIAAHLGAVGADVVDGGIIGGPAWEKSSGTRFYLSGTSAPAVATLFADSPLEAPVVNDKVGAASALKMSFAAYTKGSTALLTAILAVAETHGVRGHLEAQWGDSFSRQTTARVNANTAKAWRFAGEMREIADTFDAAGMPAGFHQAAAEVFERLANFKDNPADDIADVLRTLLNAPGRGT